jgi:hypothetical protein
LIFQSDPFGVPPWKYGGYAGLSVPTVSVPSFTKVAPVAHSAAVDAVLLPVADEVELELAQPERPRASTAIPSTILRIDRTSPCRVTAGTARA